jgi:hypothetical protein
MMPEEVTGLSRSITETSRQQDKFPNGATFRAISSFYFALSVPWGICDWRKA